MTARAVVIGCGGTIGGAWTVAVLQALSEQLDWDPRAATLIQGTSAGAELAVLLGGGIAVHELVAMERGAAADPRLRAHYAAAPPSLPPLPSPRLLNPRLLRTQRGLAALAGISPIGRGDAGWLRRLAESLTEGGEWLPHKGTRMVAVDARTGERVVFGAPGAPMVSVATALTASWGVPGWMPPVHAAGTVFIDGGAASTASLDLVPTAGLDEIYLIAPMASPTRARIPGAAGILEDRLLRRPMTAVLDAEIAGLRGPRLVTICPGRADLAGLPPNFMDRGRRREAFESAMRTAPATVAAALAFSDGEQTPGGCPCEPQAADEQRDSRRDPVPQERAGIGAGGGDRGAGQ
ncbi:patatin-like phospholipase family protein [Nocardia coffeae]|uniref:patatin-like phospholipase family protein n=1 Tax=Nocardia coffeae TaxID=2873381 RepID=UPI0027DEE98A|nr:patatin-like phospholipase family protein [Nocardia coffeae]